jgi:hypothetical protein
MLTSPSRTPLCDLHRRIKELRKIKTDRIKQLSDSLYAQSLEVIGIPDGLTKCHQLARDMALDAARDCGGIQPDDLRQEEIAIFIGVRFLISENECETDALCELRILSDC